MIDDVTLEFHWKVIQSILVGLFRVKEHHFQLTQRLPLKALIPSWNLKEIDKMGECFLCLFLSVLNDEQGAQFIHQCALMWVKEQINRIKKEYTDVITRMEVENILYNKFLQLRFRPNFFNSLAHLFLGLLFLHVSVDFYDKLLVCFFFKFSWNRLKFCKSYIELHAKNIQVEVIIYLVKCLHLGQRTFFFFLRTLILRQFVSNPIIWIEIETILGILVFMNQGFTCQRIFTRLPFWDLIEWGAGNIISQNRINRIGQVDESF